jgi:SAM-dependent methyltransferase
MARLPFDDESIDLLWSEGAIFVLGFERGLATWRSLLKPRGVLVVSEAAWLRPDPPDELRRFWEGCYPEIGSREQNAARAERLGYRVREHFPLPAESWWTHYYTPLEERLARLRSRHAGDEAALAALDEEAREIEMFRAYHEHYGYVFYVLERSD